MKMKKFGKFMALALALSMLTSCGGAGGSDAGTSSNSDASKDSDTLDLNIALTEEFVSADPNKSDSSISLTTSKHVNMGLYKFNKEGLLVLDSAKDVQISEDGCTYTFTMRDDIFWTNGTPVTAYDYEYSFKRLANPDMGCTYAYMLATIGLKNANAVAYEGAPLDDLGIKATDEKTLVLELDAPKSYITELLASSACFMAVNQEFCEEAGDQFMKDIEHSIFCGPYELTDWEIGGTTLTISKNEDYYDADTITVDSMNYTQLPDAQQRILAWEKGTLDEAPIKGDFIAMYKDDKSVMVQKLAGMFFVTFNTEDEYFSNQNLRLAISTAIDKNNIVDNILCDGSIAADYIIPANFSGDSKGVTYRENAGNPTYNEFDLTKAKEYWEKAKEELGVDEIDVEFLYNEDTQLASVAAYIQSELQKNLPGLNISLKVTTYNQRVADMGDGNYQFGITRWYADYQDPSTYLDMWIENSGLNYGSWYDEEYNDLYSKVIGEYSLDEVNRIATQAQMEKIFLEDGAVCPLYQTTTVNLRNFDLNWYTAPNNFTMYPYTDKK